MCLIISSPKLDCKCVTIDNIQIIRYLTRPFIYNLGMRVRMNTCITIQVITAQSFDSKLLLVDLILQVWKQNPVMQGAIFINLTEGLLSYLYFIICEILIVSRQIKMNSIKLSSYYEVYYVALSNFRLLLVRGIARKCAFFSYWIETVILLLSKYRLLQELSVYFHLLLCLITINRLKHQRAFHF